MYADYDYYRTLYGGKLSEEEYTFAAARASEYLASVTHDRITEDILADAKAINEKRAEEAAVIEDASEKAEQ